VPDLRVHYGLLVRDPSRRREYLARLNIHPAPAAVAGTASIDRFQERQYDLHVNLKAELLGIVKALGDGGVPYALCGGMAVVLHGSPRLTRDIDLLIRPEHLEAARGVLGSCGFSIAAGIIPFDLGRPNERRVYRVSKMIGGELLTVDLLLLPPFLEEVWQDRETYEVEGTMVHVVSRAGLIAMKRVAGRPQDLSDIASLEGDPQ
jgi:hypothetical protein